MKRVQLKPKPKGEGTASKRPASRAGEPVVKVEENQPCFQIMASTVLFLVHFFIQHLMTYEIFCSSVFHDRPLIF
jgi:hypothetical protein